MGSGFAAYDCARNDKLWSAILHGDVIVSFAIKHNFTHLFRFYALLLI